MAAKKRPPLTNKRQQWAEQRGGATFKGKPLHYPAAPASRYQADLARLVAEMVAAYERELRAAFNYAPPITQDASTPAQARMALNALQRRFNKLFAKKAPTIVDRIFGQIDKASVSSLHSSLKELSGGLSLKTTTMPASLQQAVSAATTENVALIKSIPQQFHNQIEGSVMRSLQPGGNGLQDVTEALRHYEGITKRRADLIAIDQTRKVTSAMNAERAKSAGITKFEWVHSGGGAEPRKLHLDLNGKVFSYDNLPVIDSDGTRGLPGQLINCRCIQRPVIDFGPDEDE